jgi:exodeoxyribonuclease VII small subunit
MLQEIKDMSFEEAMEELENVVRQLETGKIKLDDAVSAYERGILLKQHCEEKLQQAKSKIDKLIIDKETTIVGQENFDNDINN